jgi:hypothetical protein
LIVLSPRVHGVAMGVQKNLVAEQSTPRPTCQRGVCRGQGRLGNCDYWMT